MKNKVGALAIPMVIIVMTCFNLPLLWMLVRSVIDPDPTLRHYERIATTPVYAALLQNTLEIAALTTVVCVFLGYVIAYWITGLPSHLRLIALLFVILPFWVSVLVRTYAWIAILGRRGVLNELLISLGVTGTPIPFLYNKSGVLLGMINVLLPFVVLPTMAAMRRVDMNLLVAARSLGSSRAGAFWRIFLPLTVPTVGACGLLVFVMSLGFFITPAILGGGRVPLVATVLDSLINRYPDWGLAAALSVVISATALLIVLLYQVIMRRVSKVDSGWLA